jgi:type II secretory pathway pseudopilin PulG
MIATQSSKGKTIGTNAGRGGKRRPNHAQQGWSLMEMLVVVGVMIIVIGIAIAALSGSKTDAVVSQRTGSAKTVNEAIARAYLKGDTNAVIYGEGADDIVAAVNYLTSQGYIRN